MKNTDGKSKEFSIVTTKTFDKAYSKLTADDKRLVTSVIDIIASGKTLDQKYKDHQLKGKLKNFRDCHVKNDLVLIYKLDKNILILTAVDLGSHSNLFG